MNTNSHPAKQAVVYQETPEGAFLGARAFLDLKPGWYIVSETAWPFGDEELFIGPFESATEVAKHRVAPDVASDYSVQAIYGSEQDPTATARVWDRFLSFLFTEAGTLVVIAAFFVVLMILASVFAPWLASSLAT